MAIIKFKGFDKLEKQLKERMHKALLDKKLLNDVGEAVVKEIRGNARTSGSRTGEKFEPLSPEWVKRRQQLVESKSGKTYHKQKEEDKRARNTPDKSYSAKKSNMTLTGQTLNSISFKTASDKPLLSIVAEGDHPGYLQKDGTRTKSVPFESILKWNHEKRKVMHINPQGKIVDQIRNIVKRHLRRLLK